MARETVVVLLLGLVAALVGALYVANWDGRAVFWQNVFAPAVMMACGEAPVNPYFEDLPGLADFLEVRADRFDCAELQQQYRFIPWGNGGCTYDEIQASHPMRGFPGFTQWQQFHFYLLWIVSVCWSLLGVAWSSLLPLYGFFYGLTAVFAYGVTRQCMPRWIAIACVVMLVFSPLHLEQLPHLRDYAKAPFFMAAFFAIVWFVRRARDRRSSLAMAAATGVVLGLGLGFRQDVIIAFIGVLGAILLFSPGTLREQWRERALVALVAVAAFVVSGAPILLALQESSNAPHDTLIGVLDYTEQRLGVDNLLYDHGDPFLDEYTRSQVETFAWYQDGHSESLRHYTDTYDAYAGAYFRRVFLYFPADMVTRAFAAVVRVLDELGPRPTQPVPMGIDAWYAVVPFEVRAFVAWFLVWGNRYTTVLLLMLLAAMRPRWGWAALCMIYLFAGYTSLRFSVRHAFHLEFLSLWTSGLLLHLAILGVKRLRAGDWSTQVLRQEGKRAVVFALCAGLASLGPLWLLRGYQQLSVEGLIARFEKAPRTVVGMTVGQRDGAAWYLPKHSLMAAADTALPTRAAYLVTTLQAGDTPVDLTFHFEAGHGNDDFTRTLSIAAQTDTTVYYPVFLNGDNRFVGVSTRLESYARVGPWKSLTDLSTLPLYMTLTLPEDWARARMWQGFSR